MYFDPFSVNIYLKNWASVLKKSNFRPWKKASRAQICFENRLLMGQTTLISCILALQLYSSLFMLLKPQTADLSARLTVTTAFSH